MARSSGERTQDVKRRSARRGGSIPPRTEQQEKSIFCNVSPPLETVQPTRKEDTGQANSHTLAARKDEQKINNNHRLKRFGQRTFFRTAGKTANKRRFTDGLAAGAKRRHSWQAWKASRGCNTPPYSSRFLPFLPFSYRLTRSTLPTRPVRIRGLPQFYNQKGEPHARLLKNFPGV